MRTAIAGYINDFLAPFATVKTNAVAFAFSVPISTVVFYFEKYLWNDWEFAGFLLVAVCADTLAGVIAAFVRREFSLKVFFRKVAIKAFVYTVILVLMHLLKSAKPDGEEIPAAKYFYMLVMASMLIKEILGAFVNMSKFSDHPLLAFVRKYLADFDSKTGALLKQKINSILVPENEPEKPGDDQSTAA